MQTELEVLLLTAIVISFLHTLSGPDHYLPFVALAKARGWSVGRMLFWTLVCGCGHVWISVLLGLCGAAVGWSLSSLQWVEDIRGGMAGWALLVFGLLYGLWGLFSAMQNKRHRHFEMYEDGAVYVYEHKQGKVVAPKERHAVTPWVMFLIFVLGPCEPMIPLLYAPAVNHSWGELLLLVTVYTLFTLAAMVAMVLLGYYGITLLRLEKLNRYIHALGGMTIFICGAGMVFIGW